jgi:hypothetical protein
VISVASTEITGEHTLKPGLQLGLHYNLL